MKQIPVDEGLTLFVYFSFQPEAGDQSCIAESAALFLTVHVAGVALLSSPQYFAFCGREWMQWPTETALTAGFALIALVTITVPVLSQR